MVKLIWLVSSIATQGPVFGQFHELRKFETVAACEDYASEMAPRMQDWIRGLMQADWEHPVKVAYKCDDGDPA